MGYAEVLAARDRGQLDRVVLLTRYVAFRTDDGESALITDWTKEVWARRTVAEVSLLLTDIGTQAVYDPVFIVRYDASIDLTEHDSVFTLTEIGGTERSIRAVNPIGRRRYMELAT